MCFLPSSNVPTQGYVMPFAEDRYEKILKTIIAEYIATGEPVGSRTISKRSDIGLSAASIRNVMSDLTESGYIMQPHVSAGEFRPTAGIAFTLILQWNPVF